MFAFSPSASPEAVAVQFEAQIEGSKRAVHFEGLGKAQGLTYIVHVNGEKSARCVGIQPSRQLLPACAVACSFLDLRRFVGEPLNDASGDINVLVSCKVNALDDGGVLQQSTLKCLSPLVPDEVALQVQMCEAHVVLESSSNRHRFFILHSGVSQVQVPQRVVRGQGLPQGLPDCRIPFCLPVETAAQTEAGQRGVLLQHRCHSLGYCRWDLPVLKFQGGERGVEEGLPQRSCRILLAFATPKFERREVTEMRQHHHQSQQFSIRQVMERCVSAVPNLLLINLLRQLQHWRQIAATCVLQFKSWTWDLKKAGG